MYYSWKTIVLAKGPIFETSILKTRRFTVGNLFWLTSLVYEFTNSLNMQNQCVCLILFMFHVYAVISLQAIFSPLKPSVDPLQAFLGLALDPLQTR